METVAPPTCGTKNLQEEVIKLLLNVLAAQMSSTEKDKIQEVGIRLQVFRGFTN
jgi:hypothetical protein